MKAFPILGFRGHTHLVRNVTRQTDHLSRKNTSCRLSRTSLVHLGTELTCLVIHIQQLPLLREDKDTRVRAFFARGLSKILR